MFFGQRYEGLALPPSLAGSKSTMRVGRKPRFAAGPPFHCPPKPQRTQNTAIKQISNLIYMASSRERQRVGGRWSPDGWAWRAGARQGQSSERSVGQKQSKFRCSGPAGRFVLWRGENGPKPVPVYGLVPSAWARRYPSTHRPSSTM